MSDSILTRQQYKTYEGIIENWHGEPARVTACVRFDDQCGNGHNTFSITGSVWQSPSRERLRARSEPAASGCVHAEIAEAIPELAPFIKWHLCSTDGPLHYVANTVYHASDRDHWGLRKGEESTDPRQLKYYVRFGTSPITHQVSRKLKQFIDETIANDGEFIVDAVRHKEDGRAFRPKYQFAGMDCQWWECPFDTEKECREWLEAITTQPMEWTARSNLFGEGKPRDLNAARKTAIWPDAADEDLTADGLADRLKARLPGLLAEFRAAVESLGFTW